MCDIERSARISFDHAKAEYACLLGRTLESTRRWTVETGTDPVASPDALLQQVIRQKDRPGPFTPHPFEPNPL